MEQSSQSTKPWTDLSQYGEAPTRDHKEFPELTNAKQSKSQLRNAHVPKQSNLSNITTITSTTHGSSGSETVTQAQHMSPAPVNRLPNEEITGHDHSALHVPDLSSLSLDVSDAGLVTRAIKKDWEPTEDEKTCKELLPAQGDILTSYGPLYLSGRKRLSSFTDDMDKYGKLPQPETEITKRQISPTPPAPLKEPSHGTDLINQIDPLAPARDDQTPAQDNNEYPALTNTIPNKTKLRNAHVL